MNSLACALLVVAAIAGARAGEAPVVKRGVVGGYGLYGGYGGYASGYGHGHYGLSLAPYSSYGYHSVHPAPVAYSKVIVPTVPKVAYPAYSYSAYPLGYSKLYSGGYYGGHYGGLGYSKLAYSHYPAYSYSKVVSPYQYW